MLVKYKVGTRELTLMIEPKKTFEKTPLLLNKKHSLLQKGNQL